MDNLLSRFFQGVTAPVLQVFNAEATPQEKRDYQDMQAESEQYDNMDAYYSEYRRDSLTRNSINALAYFSTNKGFTTALDLVNPKGLNEDQIKTELEKYEDLLDYINKINMDVNLDGVLDISIKKMKIFGRAGFEILRDKNKPPERLLSRKTDRANKPGNGLVPEINKTTWQIEYFKFNYKSRAFKPEQILWFVNNDLDDDQVGLSDIEPIIHQLQTRRFIHDEAVKESVKSLWSPWVNVKIDTGRATVSEAETILNKFKNKIKPGKFMVSNQDIEVQTVDLKPRLKDLKEISESIDEDIIGNFRVPRFLLGREKQFNRATAFAEGALFMQGPITEIQRDLARQLEEKWYGPLVAEWFKVNKKGLNKDGSTPVKVKHVWKPVTMNDWVEQAEAWVKLVDSGIANRDMALDALGYDPQVIRKMEKDNPEAQAQVNRKSSEEPPPPPSKASKTDKLKEEILAKTSKMLDSEQS